MEVGQPVSRSSPARQVQARWEPRLGEALAIARLLGFHLDNLVPRAELEFYLSDVKRLMKESHAVLVAMMQSVDEVTDFVVGILPPSATTDSRTGYVTNPAVP